MKMNKIFFLIFLTLFSTQPLSTEITFNQWLKNFKTYALKNNISEETFDKTMANATFLPKVIKYDRFQPEFYEDTNTYISKRSSDNSKVKQGKDLYIKNKKNY